MIGPYDYINAMQKNEAVSNELNEIIYRISGEFWKEAYNTLLRNPLALWFLYLYFVHCIAPRKYPGRLLAKIYPDKHKSRLLQDSS